MKQRSCATRLPFCTGKIKRQKDMKSKAERQRQEDEERKTKTGRQRQETKDRKTKDRMTKT